MIIYVNVIFMLYVIYSKELNKITFNEISLEKKFKANQRYLLTSYKNQSLNNIVNIYNPYEKVAYISNVKNENGDLFITTNSENKNDNTRLVYGLRKV